MFFHVFLSIFFFYVGNRLFILYESIIRTNPFQIELLFIAMDELLNEFKTMEIRVEFTKSSLFVGGIFALIYILIVSYGSFNKKNLRINEEYGSAKWGVPKDIRNFVDKKADFNILLTKTEKLSLSSRMKISRNDNYNRNKNVVVVGGAGSGKTRFYVKPNLMQMHSSYVVSDSKGLLMHETGHMFNQAGYNIKIFDLINREETDYYNPFHYIRNEDDILKIINNLIKNTNDSQKKGGDAFFEKAETALLMAIFSYLIQEVREEDRILKNVVEMVRLGDLPEDEPGYVSPLDIMFYELEQKDPENFAVAQFKLFKLSGNKTTKSILVSLGVRLAPFDIPSIQAMLSKDTMELDCLGDDKTVLYILLPDTDTSFNFLASMMYQQLKEDNEFKMNVMEAVKIYHRVLREEINLEISQTKLIVKKRNILFPLKVVNKK
ncbi:type IV secretory system conjugative DNA transfer family protein [Enterococcus casseliflavus]|nr:type IV secretory system conjugative DNA transfer family protein [Enterococcus casseliflavus]